MSLIHQEIKDLRLMIEQFKNGKISDKYVNTMVKIYDQVEKRTKSEIMIMALAAKFGKPSIKSMIEAHYIGGGSVVDTDTEISRETIDCPDMDKVITRSECMEFSSTTGNLTNCMSCPNFKTTRKLLKEVK